MSEERSHAPTARRRAQARQDGLLPVSAVVTSWFTLLAAAVLMYLFGRQGILVAKSMFREAWSSPWLQPHAPAAPVDAFWTAVRFSVPWLVTLALAAAIGRFFQVGVLWVPQRVAPRWERLNPSQRASQLLSMETFQEKALIGGLAIAGLLLFGYGLYEERGAILAVATMLDWESELFRLVMHWVVRLTAGLAVLAIIDYALQTLRHERRLSMSNEELRAEIRAIEGNPEVARARRERGRAASDGAAMNQASGPDRNAYPYRSK